jgi:hypothetical protein
MQIYDKALMYASYQLRDNEEVVLIAMSISMNVLIYASTRLRNGGMYLYIRNLILSFSRKFINYQENCMFIIFIFKKIVY